MGEWTTKALKIYDVISDVILWHSCAVVCECLVKTGTLFHDAACPSVIVLHSGMLKELLMSWGRHSAIAWQDPSAWELLLLDERALMALCLGWDQERGHLE